MASNGDAASSSEHQLSSDGELSEDGGGIPPATPTVHAEAAPVLPEDQRQSVHTGGPSSSSQQHGVGAIRSIQHQPTAGSSSQEQPAAPASPATATAEAEPAEPVWKKYKGKFIYKKDYIPLREPQPWCDEHGWKLWETANNRNWLTRTYRRWVPERDDEDSDEFEEHGPSPKQEERPGSPFLLGSITSLCSPSGEASPDSIEQLAATTLNRPIQPMGVDD